MTRPMPPPASQLPLAIICGAGSLPFALADAGLRQGRRVVLIGLRGFADPERIANYPHHWLRMGDVGALLRVFAAENVRDVSLIGAVTRPSWRQMRPDLRALLLLPRILHMFKGGDNHLLSELARAFEDHGFRLLAPHEIAPELLMPVGPLGTRAPDERDRADIARGLELLAATSPFDVGQAVVVGNNQVLALEGPEGTDRMVARIAELRRDGRIRMPVGVGVLVKAPKVGQDRRIDLPTIGSRTVEAAAVAGLAGIAVVAGSSIVAEPDLLAGAADRAGLFVMGVPAGGRADD